MRESTCLRRKNAAYLDWGDRDSSGNQQPGQVKLAMERMGPLSLKNGEEDNTTEEEEEGDTFLRKEVSFA